MIPHIFISPLILAATPLLVHLCHNGVADVLNLLELVIVLIDLGFLVVVHPLQSLLHGVGHGLLVILADLVLHLVLHSVLHVVQVGLELVACINALLDRLVVLSELLGLLHHALNLLLAQAALVAGDGDLLLLAGALVLSTHIQDTVGIHLKGHLNLGGTAGGRGDTVQVKLAQLVVVLGHGALALKDLDGHSGLLVLVGGEGLALLGGDDSVAGDELGHDATHGLDTQGQGRHIQQQDVLHLITTFTAQDATLHSCAEGYSLIRVDALAGLLAFEVLLQQLLDLGNAGGPAH
mmetsp:Transcript_17432/g.48427  ORF Transcript_17432/g.48427 Transcript_17432/m.48427 type:complete len:293 (-) Transcript_17432:1188-2066(-)